MELIMSHVVWVLLFAKIEIDIAYQIVISYFSGWREIKTHKDIVYVDCNKLLIQFINSTAIEL